MTLHDSTPDQLGTLQSRAHVLLAVGWLRKDIACTDSACLRPAQVGILGVKGSYTSPLVIPLLFLTAIVAQVCRGVFERPFQVMSLRGAVDLDNHEKVRGCSLKHAGPSQNRDLAQEGALETPSR